ncbi:hypothetical protein [Streptomyces olivaceus]|uniref:hypothetical protein n=1 Tax=Streptomyces olivaceus TaxID=47716 RepID=UPI0022EDF4DE|nr:hypothetical protein [Streptomyces olivaceus]GHI91289.1 hypothetical protein TPA0905_07600 [Streptomyces olivaceus]
MLHHLLIVAELREIAPQTEWAEHEATGRACVVCPCGLNTGFTDRDEAAVQYREHAQANQPVSAVRIHPEIGPAAEVLQDMLGEITRED